MMTGFILAMMPGPLKQMVTKERGRALGGGALLRYPAPLRMLAKRGRVLSTLPAPPITGRGKCPKTPARVPLISRKLKHS
jgi:hypothetical protein